MTTTSTESETETTTLRTEVRGFLHECIRDGVFVPAVDSWVRGWDEDFSRELGRRGYLGITIPTEYGGQGRSHLDRFIVTEELLAAGAPVAAHWIADRQIAPSLLAYGTDSQKRDFLPRIARGECYFAIGMSEPDAGSDLAGVRTRADRTEGGYVINGSKVWTSGAHLAEAFFVLARTTPTTEVSKHQGLSQFIVRLDLPGVTVRPIITSDGSHHFNEVFLDDVFVREQDVLGEIGGGWKQVTSELAYERSGPERFLSTYPLLGAVADDMASAASDAAAGLGRLTARLAALHAMSSDVAHRLNDGQRADVDAALVKLLGTSFEGDVVAWVDDVIGSGEVEMSPRVDALMHTALVQRAGFTLRGGTSEVLRGVVTKGMAR